MVSENVMAIIGGIGLAAWVIVPLVVIALPQRQHDPQRGMAVGLLMIVSLIGGVVALFYAAGLYWHIRLFIYVPFWITSFVGALIGLNLVVLLVRKLR